jgi:hypothetical protein
MMCSSDVASTMTILEADKRWTPKFQLQCHKVNSCILPTHEVMPLHPAQLPTRSSRIVRVPLHVGLF